MKFKSLCFPRTNLTKQFAERMATRGSKGRIYGWSPSVITYGHDVPCAPASATNTATRKGFVPNTNELKSLIGVSGVNFTTGRFRLMFVNASGRDAFKDTVAEVEVNGYRFDASGFNNQSSKNLESKDSAVRAAAMTDINLCQIKVFLK